VLRMRFGIDTASDYTLEELGKRFDVTRERIRQIESKAMRKLMLKSAACFARRRSSRAFPKSRGAGTGRVRVHSQSSFGAVGLRR
jgi:hypothetical protein